MNIRVKKTDFPNISIVYLVSECGECISYKDTIKYRL